MAGGTLRELSRSTYWSLDNGLFTILVGENVSIWLSVKLLAEAEADGWDGCWNILCQRISTPTLVDYSAFEASNRLQQ